MEAGSTPVKKSKAPVWAGIAIVLLLLAGGGLLRRNAGGSTEPPVQASSLPDAVASAPGGESLRIAIPGFPRVTVKAGSREVTLPYYNPEENGVYFTFTLALKGSGEVLYQSEQIAPGQGLNTVSLNRPLETGEYEAVLQVDTHSLEDGSPKNGARLDTLLIAK